MGFDWDDGSGGWGCVLVMALAALVLVAMLFVYADDWLAIQAHKAEARLALAQADRAWARAEQARAEAVGGVTDAAGHRMDAANLAPWVPLLAFVAVLAPFAVAAIRRWGG